MEIPRIEEPVEMQHLDKLMEVNFNKLKKEEDGDEDELTM